MPDSTVARGTGLIAEAWLGQPVGRYGHGVLGDRTEAGTLYARLANGRVVGHRLDSRSVFEDLTVRLADLNGNGQDELVVVQSSLEQGSALAVLGLRAGRLQAIARTPWIGTRNRWLNPAGIADYDGDGVMEIALVRTPHIGGTLQFWQLAGGELIARGELYGFSNHRIGSRIQDLSATLDWDGDGIADLLLPEVGRRSLAVVTLSGGTTRVLTTLPLPAEVKGPLTLNAGGRSVRVPLENGETVSIGPDT
ncbi:MULTISPECIES: VCBS repeat-containing protein [unclassified Minwuia]|uniref:FG-GAP repeat domain-containing protein n=1 Tax=unclassified Minwuia TaxID=2618799 RepID=UPI002479296C|nr:MULTISPECIES: VCBS repeat-containing protein [unclassified Minwuia]